MKRYQKKIQDYQNLIQKQYVRESAIQGVIDRCSEVMTEPEDIRTSYFEFLYEQSRFIKKRWWGLQGCVLILLWLLLGSSDSGVNIERQLGIWSTAFAVLIVPEIWKNRRFSAVEIEKSSFYSLRQICAARMLLFAVVDLIMVTVFFAVTFNTVQISAYRIVINFLIPFNVSNCICFRLLYSRWSEMEYVAVLAGMVWILIWSAIVTYDMIYHKIAESIWLGLVLVSFGYLIFCVRKSQAYCEIIWEGKNDGIRI